MPSQDSTIARNTNNNLTDDDKRRFDMFSDYFTKFLDGNSSKKNTGNRDLDPKVGKQLLKLSARPSFVPPHYCTMHAESGRTSRNIPRRDQKGEVIKKKGEVQWLHGHGVCVVWTAGAFRDMRKEKSGLKRSEVFYRIPWSKVPKKFRKVLLEGAEEWNGRTIKINGKETSIQPKLRQPGNDFHNYLNPTHVALLLRRKPGQKWTTPQWVILGTWGSNNDSKRIPAVLDTALCWQKGALPKLGEFTGAPEDIVPNMGRKQSKPALKAKTVDESILDDEIIF